MRTFWVVIFIFFSTFLHAEDSAGAYVCEKTDTGARLSRDGQTFWEFCADSPEGKPFVHPIALPDGRVVTDLRPDDHVWHMGLWFCWKYVNGVNYWEPADAERIRPAGETHVRDWDVEITSENAAVVRMTLVYRPRETPEKVVMTEKRRIEFSAPDEMGNYTITSRHHFEIGTEDVELERTPPHARGGGYAGLGLRLNNQCSDFVVTCSNGGTDMPSIRAADASWVDYRDAKTGLGIRFTVLRGTPQTRFYAQKSANYCFVNPCPVHESALRLPAGGELDLEYEIRIGK